MAKRLFKVAEGTVTKATIEQARELDGQNAVAAYAHDADEALALAKAYEARELDVDNLSVDGETVGALSGSFVQCMECGSQVLENRELWQCKLYKCEGPVCAACVKTEGYVWDDERGLGVKPAAALGRKGGSAKTAAKRTASRLNGKKGGRPTIHFGDWKLVHFEEIDEGSLLVQFRAGFADKSGIEGKMLYSQVLEGSSWYDPEEGAYEVEDYDGDETLGALTVKAPELSTRLKKQTIKEIRG